MRNRSSGLILSIAAAFAIVSGMVGNVSANATFTLTPSAGPGGTISPNTPKTAEQGATTTFSVTPDAGYIASVSGTCGGSLSGNTYTTNVITESCTVIASFTHYRYRDNDNGTVLDKATGLTWQMGENAIKYNWYQASGIYDATYNHSVQNVCGSLGLDGGGWRLPTLTELQSLVEVKFNPTINTSFFPEAYAYNYWSSSTQGTNTYNAWNVNFRKGVNVNNGKPYTYHVRCVR